MNETPKTKSGWRWLRRILIALAVLATLIAIFYTEEDWRGKHAWENCKRELEAKGEVLDWNAYIPSPVPDDQNFFKAPKMTDWFVKGQHGTELQSLLQNSNTFSVITTEAAANNYRTWCDQLQPDFDLIREALKRPYARINGDYSTPYQSPIPNFISTRILAQVLAQRTKCYLLLGEPDNALHELTLLNDSRRLLENAPTGKPMFLVSAMINVAVTALYVYTIADGLQSHAWQEPQLAAIQEQLQKNNMAPFVFEAFKEEQAHTVYLGEKSALRRNFGKVMTGELFDYGQGKTFMQKLKAHAYDLMPQGWVFQNMVVATKIHQQLIDTFDPTEKQIFPKKLDEAYLDVTKKLQHHSVFHLLADIAIPNYSRAFQTFAYNQTTINEAQIVCALERYHLAHNEYPETLDALSPQFIETIPHDIIGGAPLHYRRTDDRKFLLYSVGWNEMDDGGEKHQYNNVGRGVDYSQGDWVWQN